MAKKEKQIGIKSLVLEVADKKLTISLDEARKLRDALNEVFGKVEKERVIEYRNGYWPYYYSGSTTDVTFGSAYDNVTLTSATTCDSATLTLDANNCEIS